MLRLIFGPHKLFIEIGLGTEVDLYGCEKRVTYPYLNISFCLGKEPVEGMLHSLHAHLSNEINL